MPHANTIVPVTPLQQVAAILAKYGANAHIYLPGLGVINGITAGNYSDSAGTTAAVVDGSVGLDLDAAGSLGPELVVNGDFSGGATGWAYGTGCTINTTGAHCNGTGTAFGTLLQKTIGTTSTWTYLVTYTIANYVSGNCRFYNTPFGTTRNANGTYTEYVVASTADVVMVSAGTAFNGDITLVSVKNISGIHATQATAGFKPKLARGAVNLLLNSATFVTQNVTCVATPYTLSFAGTGTITLGGTGTGNKTGIDVNTRVSLTFTPTAGSVTFTLSGGAGTVINAQLEVGSTASTYIPTTSAAASSSTGNYHLDYIAASTQYLSLSSVPFQMSDDHCVIAGARRDSSTATDMDVIHCGYGAASQNICRIGLSATLSRPYVIWADDAATSVTLTDPTAYLATPVVISARKQGNAKILRVNGIQNLATNNTALSTTTVVGASIGCYKSAVSNFLQGAIYPIIAIKGTVSDADLLTLERWVGTMSGVTI